MLENHYTFNNMLLSQVLIEILHHSGHTFFLVKNCELWSMIQWQSNVSHLKPVVDHSVDEGVHLRDPVHAGAHQLGTAQPPLPDPGRETHGAVQEDLIGHWRQTSPRAPPIESRETEVRDEVA